MTSGSVEEGRDPALPGQRSPEISLVARAGDGPPDERGLGEQRRILGGRLLMDGMRQAHVARAVGVTRKAVSLWNRQLVAAGGLCGLQGRPRGRPAGLSEQQKEELLQLLMSGALAQGFTTELWTVRRVRQLVAAKFNRHYSESQIHRILVELGFSSQAPTAMELSRDGAVIRRWKLSDGPADD